MGDMDRLGTIIVKRYGTGTEQAEAAEVIGICDAPSFKLRSSDGSEYHWRQDLTRPATHDEAIRYWQTRTESAERLLNKSLNALSKSSDHVLSLAERLSQHVEHCTCEKR